MSRRELVGYGGLLSIITFLLLFQHIIKGGFYSDDYPYHVNWLVFSRHGFWDGFTGFFHDPLLVGRPTLAFYLSLTNGVFGSHQGMYLAWAAVLAVICSMSAYVLLRTLGFRPLEAGLIGLLLVVFPQSDSTRAWSIISDAQVAMSLAFLGVTCTLRSLTATGRHRWLLRFCGLCLVFLGVTTYELTFVALMCAFLLYRTRANWRRALLESALDWILLGLIYALITSHTIAVRLSIHQTMTHGGVIARQAVALLLTQALPFGTVAAGATVTLGIVAGAAAVYRLAPEDDPVRTALRRWIITLGIGIVMLAAAYVIYAPAALFYTPFAPGLENRTNAFAALPIMVIIYSLAAMVAIMAFRGLELRSVLIPAAAATVVIAVGIGYTVGFTHDLKLWDSGYHRAQETMIQLRRELPPPAHDSLVVFYGQPIEEAPGIPVWSSYWDVSGAFDLAFHDPTLQARPAFAGTKIECFPKRARMINTVTSNVVLPSDIYPYGRLYLYNTVSGLIDRPMNQSQCRSEAPTFVPGPFYATSPGADSPGL